MAIRHARYQLLKLAAGDMVSDMLDHGAQRYTWRVATLGRKSAGEKSAE